ncbi:MAG: hypothetical protein LBJ46_08440 [Planctomycetota bacterium]|jgi:Tfp pilus assembly protein PilN|nr:hypothetical protein [Planctomycetota bacterium]
MININLLPEVMRKKDSTPTPQFLIVLVGLAILGAVGYCIFLYSTQVIPGLNNRIVMLEREKRDFEAQAAELKEIRQEIERLTEYVDTVKGLYRSRIVWAKVLSDIKEIINFDPSMSEYNQEMRYLWLISLKGDRDKLTMGGYATAANPVLAMQMPELLLQGFRTHAPRAMPERDEEERLNEELRQAIAENDAMRRDNPDLPLQGAREIALRERLTEIREIESGGVAMQPFSSLLVPGTLGLVNATWSQLPRMGARGQEAAPELFPTQAWSFNISMELK